MCVQRSQTDGWQLKWKIMHFKLPKYASTKTNIENKKTNRDIRCIACSSPHTCHAHVYSCTHT